MKLRELRLSTRITISTLIIVTVGAVILAFIENARIRDAYTSERRTHLKNSLETEKLRLNQAIDSLRQDVLFLSNTPPVSGIVRAALNHGYDPRYGNTHKVWAERLEQIFSAFSRAHPNYYQIRYIGVAAGGREIVRVDNHAGKIEVTPPGSLQAKGAQGYFKTTLGLRSGEIYLSEFDLNQNDAVIERPYWPTLRAATPVFTASGEMFGMVVISMDVNSLLVSAVSDLPGVQTYISNGAGQYLLHPEPQQAFKFEPGSKNIIATDFPVVETLFNPQKPDYLPLENVSTRAGSALVSAQRIYFVPGDLSRFLILLYSIPGTAAAKQIATIPAQNIIGGFIAMLLVGGIALLVLRRAFSPLEKIATASDKIAAGDHDVLLPQYSSGEIGSLTNALNAMLTQLSLREKSLLESEARYRRLYESMRDAYVVVDMSGRLLEFNHTYREMLGYSAEELQRKGCTELTPEKWHEFEARIIEEQVIPHGYSQVYEKEYIRKDGTVFPVEFKAFLLQDKNGQPDAMWAIVRDITERKQAEGTLRLHSEILQNLLEGVILVRASDGTIVFTNPQFERMFGYGSDELLGKPASIVNAPGEASQEAVANAIIAELEQTGVWNGEVRNIRKDGSAFWCHANISTFEHPQFGRVWVSVHDDITKRKRAEEELQRFFDLIPDLACIASTDGHFLKINSAWLTLLGYTEQELLFTPFMDFIHPDDREASMKEVERQIGGDATIHFINRYRCKDGSYRWLEWQTTPAIGKTLLYATARDITERRQTEERLQKSAEEIADLYNHAPCGYHSLDKGGNIRRMNDTELAWLGYTRNEVIGKMKWPDLLAPSGLLVFRETFPQLMRQGYIRDLEAEILRKDGSTFTGLINASAIYDASGNFVMSRSTIIDITGRKRAERQLQELSAHLQTIREEEKARIAREIHDDLGGTLTALKMDAYWFAKKLPLNKEAEPFLKRINSMSQLLDSAVGVTRRIITDLRPTILDDLGLLAALEWQAAQFQKRTGIKCHVNGIEGKDALGKEYSIALFRIFQETLTNIARHSGASRVEVEFQSCDEEVILSISDNGSGLPEGHRIAPTSYGMRGMCERVEQLGGKIKFDSPPGGGFCVAVTLPSLAENIEGSKA
jgi:PAS domain S-box-containing protein